jgi:uncharacterized protein involved in outer membrane biogenesis
MMSFAFDRRRLRQVGLLILLAIAVILTLPVMLTPGLRGRLAAALGERFDSEVELQTLRVSVLPRVRLDGTGVVLRHRGRRDVPPLITIAAFSAEANLWSLFGRPLRLARVRLDRLEINVPAGGVDLDDDEDDAQDKADPKPDEPAPQSPLVVDDLLAERATLRILRSSPEKKPRIFEIVRLSMQDTGSNAPWPFKATLTNPTPPGEISTQGKFGPWNADQPASTPLDASYEFQHADLGAFDGIEGTLHSTGQFGGVLERIQVRGSTEVPDFALDDVGHGIPLTTQFRALVDGTNGNTRLQPVDAMLGGSAIHAEGGVIERADGDGRTVSLDVTMNPARIEDVLRLAMKNPTPPMVGALTLKARIELPPGDGDPIDKLRLDGTFDIASAHFTKGVIQEKINELSEKARGDGDSDSPPDRVVSNFSGRFVMRDGVITLSDLSFMVPGARVSLAGRYTVRSEALDFRGTIRLDAKLSELTTGVKSFLLKLVDPIVRRKGETVIPVTLRGTASKPDFGVDIRRAFTPK